MGLTIVDGIDPGLVHTGVVRFVFDQDPSIGMYKLDVRHSVIQGFDMPALLNFVVVNANAPLFVEAYRPRSHFSTDKDMVEGIAKIKQAFPRAKVLPNMGIKNVVTEDFMKVLGCWDFNTPTHHQDLRSAARIALLGMYKDPMLNQVVADHARHLLNPSQP